MKALILAGGSGTRFWPASRRLRPKQLLPLRDGKSFLRRTVDRLLPIVDPADIWICTGSALVDQVVEQAPEVARERVLAEPAGRNTAPAIAWSLSSMPPEVRGEVLVSLHSDHWIEDEDDFRRSLEAAVASVEESDAVMALGVKPTRPETGYGYMEPGAQIDAERAVYRVSRFLEKPLEEQATEFVEAGFVWNSGIFVFRIGTMLDHLRRLEPGLMTILDRIAARPDDLAELWSGIEPVPIDTAVMERLETMSTRVLDCGWNDVGSWDALAEILASDAEGNAFHGDGVVVGGTDNLLYSERGTIAVVGVDGLAVVATEDAVLVVPKSQSQRVREIVAELQSRGSDALL